MLKILLTFSWNIAVSGKPFLNCEFIIPNSSKLNLPDGETFVQRSSKRAFGSDVRELGNTISANSSIQKMMYP